MKRRLSTMLIVLTGLTMLAGAGYAQSYVGEYEGTFYPDRAREMKATGKVTLVGDNVCRLILEAKDEENLEGIQVEIYGAVEGPMLFLFGKSGGYSWGGEVTGTHLSAGTGYHQRFELDKVNRHSPTEGAEPPENAVVLLPFKQGEKPDLGAWTNDQWEVLDSGAMRVKKGAGNTKTKQEFTDIKQFHLEFRVPLEPGNTGQGRGNSGVFFNANYEVQILDSFGVIPTCGDCGGIYNLARPMKDATLPPGFWQTYDISFKAPRIKEDGTVAELPRITVNLNGVKIHDDLEIPYSTYGDQKGHVARGPIELQDHSHPVEFRNIWLVEE